MRFVVVLGAAASTSSAQHHAHLLSLGCSEALDYHAGPLNQQLKERVDAALAQLAEKGKLKVDVARSFRLEELADAHRLSEQGHTRGKIVVRID